MSEAGYTTCSLDVEPDIQAKWQDVLDLMARIVNVPAALINRTEPPCLRIFLASRSPGNPYAPDQLCSLDTVLYCNTVMRSRAPVIIPNALQDDYYRQSPNVPLGMISYLGVPLLWPNEDMFGTLCVLDNKENAFNDIHLELLQQFRGLVERDLRLIYERRRQAKRDAAMLEQVIASAKMATVGRLVAGLAHELNTPLGNIVLGTSTLSAQLADIERQVEARTLSQGALQRLLADGREACDMIERNGTRAADLLASVKQVAVDQDGEARRRFLLDETVDHVARAMGPQLRREQVTLHVAVPSGLEMDSYRGHVEQILVTLLGNSVQHAFAGRGQRQVHITARQDGDMLELVYSDNGCGIDSALLPRVFDPFYTTRIGEGARGLGLAIMLNAVQAILKGSVRLESAAGAGVHFTFRLPLSPTAE